jgi:hypothetical protein
MNGHAKEMNFEAESTKWKNHCVVISKSLSDRITVHGGDKSLTS